MSATSKGNAVRFRRQVSDQKIHTIRREEDRQLEHELEQELLRMFPDELRAVRLVRAGEE
jgi:hypothetical protein